MPKPTTKQEALDYCYKHESEFKSDCYRAGEDGQRQFDYLISCVESGHIKPEELPSYGMDYDDDEH